MNSNFGMQAIDVAQLQFRITRQEMRIEKILRAINHLAGWLQCSELLPTGYEERISKKHRVLERVRDKLANAETQLARMHYDWEIAIETYNNTCKAIGIQPIHILKPKS